MFESTFGEFVSEFQNQSGDMCKDMNFTYELADTHSHAQTMIRFGADYRQTLQSR